MNDWTFLKEAENPVGRTKDGGFLDRMDVLKEGVLALRDALKIMVDDASGLREDPEYKTMLAAYKALSHATSRLKPTAVSKAKANKILRDVLYR